MNETPRPWLGRLGLWLCLGSAGLISLGYLAVYFTGVYLPGGDPPYWNGVALAVLEASLVLPPLAILAYTLARRHTDFARVLTWRFARGAAILNALFFLFAAYELFIRG